MASNEYVGGLDIVGGYDIVGYDAHIGAAPAKTYGMAPNARLAMSTPDVARRQVAPISSKQILAGQTVTLTFRPQRPLRIERLVLDGAAAGGGGLGGVFVQEILVGAEPQFVNTGDCPISTFSPFSFGTALQGNTAVPGIDISISVYNSTGATVTVGGAVIGTSLT